MERRAREDGECDEGKRSRGGGVGVKKERGETKVGGDTRGRRVGDGEGEGWRQKERG